MTRSDDQPPPSPSFLGYSLFAIRNSSFILHPSSFLLRSARLLGWLVFVGSVGVVAVVVVYQAAAGPVAEQSAWPTPRLWRYFVTSLLMAAGATTTALILSLPAAIALVQARRPRQRDVLYALTLIPLLTMPAIFAYAWMLLATSRSPLIASIVGLLGWNTPGLEPLQAALVLGAWLWPIPALILASSFKHVGARAYQLASLDASPARALFRGALPVMRAPLLAALTIVFILSITDSTVPPLMQASRVWAVEMLASASIAMRYERPVGYLFWQSWPMLAAVAVLAVAAAPGVRQMAGWADEPDSSDTGSRAAGRFGPWMLACLIAAAITLLPIIVFTAELATGRGAVAGAISAAWKTSGNAAMATLLVAGLSVLAALALAVASIEDRERPAVSSQLSALSGQHSRTAGRGSQALVFCLGVAVAALPPELTGTALAAFYSSEWISPRDAWNVYDHSPLVWAAAIQARFGFLVICVARLLNRRVPQDLVAQAASDGAGRMERILHARLPFLWRPMSAAAIMVGCLAISEASASVLIQPPQFFGGSLAVFVDSQMHYGRQNQTVVLSLMLLLPAILAAVALPTAARKRMKDEG